MINRFLKNNLTFCLIILAFSLSAKASEFNSPHLEAFYQKAAKVKAATLDGVEYCKLFHKGVSLAEDSKYKLEVYNTNSLKEVSESDIKEILIETEKKDPTFWETYGIQIDPKKLNTLSEVVSSNVFNDLSGVVDNIYCFPYLGADFEKDVNRKKVVNALTGIESKIQSFIYYDDGFYSKSVSVLIVYLLDIEKNEVYAIKGIIK